MPKTPKRIVLDRYDAGHVYEWLRMYWREEQERFGGCYDCERIGRRLERLIGPAEVRRVGRVVAETTAANARPSRRKTRGLTVN